MGLSKLNLSHFQGLEDSFMSSVWVTVLKSTHLTFQIPLCSTSPSQNTTLRSPWERDKEDEIS